ncbi:30S ribosomal protein S16 [Marichromatium bheemlicum]|uniref:Small ribosomal subunit protein bS16 n=1 Tax=Marichromatium bheemlicum TaxID=365339 RepID=A0ABX1I8M9_9GAMM|nr:30S ribosomal protein S16 [Marichromatium bheemlicum]NKN33618.1 30S ribosomal protein S16 [Marichromatium bheemlicum]
MVTIRLSRGGSKKNPFYQVVVADVRAKRDGRYIERLGFYNPSAKGGEVPLRINRERADYWLAQGAQPSERAAQLLKQAAKDVETVAA